MMKMNDEPKCVVWKRLGAKRVMKQVEGLTQTQELEYWRKRTELLMQSKKQAIEQQSLTNNTK